MVGIELVILFAFTFSDANLLEQICPVEWRGLQASSALAELKGRLDLKIEIDSGLDQSRLQREVRFSASHLTGAQVLRWLGRLSDFNVRINEKTVRVMPIGNPAAISSSGDRSTTWASVASRRTGIHWRDTPLSRVAGDVSSGFEVDIIFDRSVLDDGGLVTLDNSSIDLQRVCHDLADQLQAVVEFVDGALWVHRRPATDSQRPVEPATQPERPSGTASPMPALAKSVHLTRSVATWQEWGEELNRLTGGKILMEIPSLAAYSMIEAEGRLLDILEAGRLLGVFTWAVEPGQGADGDGSVRIRIRSDG